MSIISLNFDSVIWSDFWKRKSCSSAVTALPMVATVYAPAIESTLKT